VKRRRRKKKRTFIKEGKDKKKKKESDNNKKKRSCALSPLFSTALKLIPFLSSYCFVFIPPKSLKRFFY
jgi:hypothetical protein